MSEPRERNDVRDTRNTRDTWSTKDIGDIDHGATIQRVPGTKSWKDVPNESVDTGQNTSPPRDKSEFIRGDGEFVPGEPTYPMETADEQMSSLPRDDPQMRTLENNERDRQVQRDAERSMERQEIDAKDRRADYAKERVRLSGPDTKPGVNPVETIEERAERERQERAENDRQERQRDEKERKKNKE